MNKSSSFTICLLIPDLMTDQIQQGYVKTKGRLANNGTVIAGTRLSGATVTIQGGFSVLSGNNGKFSFSIPGSNYYLKNVQKQGYVLTDPDVLNKQYTYSKNPMVLVMETPQEQADDKLAAEKKIRRTLQQQLQEKEDELEALKEQQKLSDEEYRKQLQEIFAMQESNEKLISEMAGRYSKIDFDEIDEFNRRISQLILEGNLAEADSLLHTKGDINHRTVILRQHQETNDKEEQDIEKKRKRLEKSKALVQKELEDLARDCYSKHEIFKMQHQIDSAEYYIELRAELDTTNINWQLENASFLFDYLSDYKSAYTYSIRALSEGIRQGGKKTADVAEAYAMLCVSTVFACGNFREGSEYIENSLAIREEIFGSNHVKYAETCISMGALRTMMGQYDEAIKWFNKALPIFNKNSEQTALCLAHIGNTYLYLGEYEKAERYYNEALEIRKQVHEPNSPHLARNYNHLALIELNRNRTDLARQYCNKALEIYNKCYTGPNHVFAILYHTLGKIAVKEGKNHEALDLFTKSLNLYNYIFGETHLDNAICYSSIGAVYYNLRNYSKSLDYYKKALTIQENVLGTEHLNVAQSYSYIGANYYSQGNLLKAIEYFSKAMSIYKKLYGEDHPNTQEMQSKINEIQSKQNQ